MRTMRTIKITVFMPGSRKRTRACKDATSAHRTLQMQVDESLTMEAFDEAVCAHVDKALGEREWIVASRCMGWIDTPDDCWTTQVKCKDEFFVTEHKYLKGPHSSEEMWKEFSAFVED